MVSFVCEACNDVIKKPKLQQHYPRCRAPFTCIDCNKTFPFGEFQKHSSCISEAQKYEKTVWKGDKPAKGQKGRQQQQQQQQSQQSQSAPEPQAASNVNPVAETSSSSALPALATSSIEASTTTERNINGVPSKKEKKDKKRKRADDVATATNGTNAEAQAVGQEANQSTANGDEDKSEKKKKKNKKNKEDKEAVAEQSNGLAEEKPTLGAVLAQSLSNEGASITLKELLEKVADNESQLTSVQISLGKKGRYILSVN